MSLITLILFVAGLAGIVFGAELFVRGASRLAAAFSVSSLVIGLTVVAYGTSSPELAVSLRSGLTGSADLALGNVVGSNICNILLILGISSVIVPLSISRPLIRWDVPLMIGISVLVLCLGMDGWIGRWDGLMLITAGLIYTVRAVHQGRRDFQQGARPSETDPDGTSKGLTWVRWLKPAFSLIAGLVILVLGADWAVDGAVAISKYLGVTELIIGLTIVAVGTSLPELATSAVASFRGERDIAVGNAVGSNIFNILFVLGAVAVITPDGIRVSKAAIHFDLPVMVAVAVACLPVFLTGGVISRREGVFFLLCYLAYVMHLVAGSSGRSTSSYLHIAVIVLVGLLVAVTVVTIGMQVWHLSSARRGGNNAD